MKGKTICLELEEPLSKPQDCDEGWFYFPSLNSCYRYFNVTRTWQEAEEFCNQLPYYGNLATVTSDEHNTFISNVVRAVDASKPWTWIGLNDIWKEGTFSWVDGTSYTYRNWIESQPDDYRGNEDCVHIKFTSKCSSKKNVIFFETDKKSCRSSEGQTASIEKTKLLMFQAEILHQD
ncbi:alpha-N-acetylgalactosamine-specific lectin-like [Hypanus sabinus]|uniref:alpha-N-acetylgalactosamine-specific lectin-like n=1 Tax=Hypanus sabinus TaxID=79690 RepID=UPI0028C3F833|nr:alpha-N-acetylgalactosamine-specific lectin-like [Hypanus sabinus]